MTTETKPLDIPSVGEQIEINRTINERIQRRGKCVWKIDDIFPGLAKIACTGGRVTRPPEAWKYCAYCGKMLVVGEQDKDKNNL